MNLYQYFLGLFLKFIPSGYDDGTCNFLTVGTCTYEDEFLIRSYEVSSLNLTLQSQYQGDCFQITHDWNVFH